MTKVEYRGPKDEQCIGFWRYLSACNYLMAGHVYLLVPLFSLLIYNVHLHDNLPSKIVRIRVCF